MAHRTVPKYPNRIYGRPLRGEKVARYYYDTRLHAFYSIPTSRFPRRRLDVEELLKRPTLSRDFRVRDNGAVYFRGVGIRYNVNRPPRRRLRSTEPEPPAPDEPEPLVADVKYAQRIVNQNPGYSLLSIRDRLLTFRGKQGRVFVVQS